MMMARREFDDLVGDLRRLVTTTIVESLSSGDSKLTLPDNMRVYVASCYEQEVIWCGVQIGTPKGLIYKERSSIKPSGLPLKEVSMFFITFAKSVAFKFGAPKVID